MNDTGAPRNTDQDMELEGKGMIALTLTTLTFLCLFGATLWGVDGMSKELHAAKLELLQMTKTCKDTERKLIGEPQKDGSFKIEF